MGKILTYEVEQYLDAVDTSFKDNEGNSIFAIRSAVYVDGRDFKIQEHLSLQKDYDNLEKNENKIYTVPQNCGYGFYHKDVIEHLRTHAFFEFKVQEFFIFEPYTYISNKERMDDLILMKRISEDNFVDINNKRFAISYHFTTSMHPFRDDEYDLKKVVEYLSNRKDIIFEDKKGFRESLGKINNHIMEISYHWNDESFKSVVPFTWIPTQKLFDKFASYGNDVRSNFLNDCLMKDLEEFHHDYDE